MDRVDGGLDFDWQSEAPIEFDMHLDAAKGCIKLQSCGKRLILRLTTPQKDRLNKFLNQTIHRDG